VTTGCGRVAALTAVLFLWAAAAVRAEPIETTAALSVNGLTGSHEVSRGQRDRFSLAPLPLAELTFRYGAHSLRFEGLPEVTLGYAATNGATTTRLSILNATYRAALPSGWYAGAGETVYNQRSLYPPSRGAFYAAGNQFFPIGTTEVQASRVAGMRYELGRDVQLGGNRLEVNAALNPRMHGITYTTLSTGAGQFATTSTFTDPESASQIDLMARLAHRVSKRGEVLFGLRYINYTARYDAAPGQLADRNTGFAPSLGYRLKI
jgi:hypothetical protein